LYEKSKFKVSAYQNEIDIREEEINRLKRQLGLKEEEALGLGQRVEQMAARMKDIEEELELKSGENNRLRAQVADMEKTVQDLYVSRKGEGSFEVELDKLKADNERLILLLRNSNNEYQDMTDSDILKKAGLGASLKSRKSATDLSAKPSGGLGGPNL
jgi:septal ring factor EnvC (AmiA/AmiB activator)